MIGQGEIIVIDDFISFEYQEKIKQELLGLDNNFPWFYTEDVTGVEILIVNTEQDLVINM